MSTDLQHSQPAEQEGQHVDSSAPDYSVPMEPHVDRASDVYPKAERRVERQVAFFFILSALATIGFVAAFVAVPLESYWYVPFFGDVNASNLMLGLTFGIAIFSIGVGAIHWAKKVMPDTEVVDERSELTPTTEAKQEAIDTFFEQAEGTRFGQSKIIRRTLLGALALFPIPLVVLLRDMGPLPEESLRHTMWREGLPLVTAGTRRKIRPEDIPVGGLVNAEPEGMYELQHVERNQNERAKASIIVVRIAPDDIVSQQAPEGQVWDYQGILAFSKICTHAGCPISLYQRRSHQLLCPCHQSTFDLADSALPVFGPAARHMPQLPITVNEEGYLVAQSDFAEPVGPSFWERG